MAKIIKLSPHVADLIAAGEVVERPASVVKELTENAIDAGAKHVTVEIKNGGMTFIRVTDDGCGMEREDAETAFLRHATSKLRTADDLAAIRTLGFRGEALAATAAVSRIELLTKTEEAELGVSLRLEGGTQLSCEEAGCPKGTTIVVRDLFFNTPARMKFMKRDSVEASAILGALQRQALSHPPVAFRYIRDGQEELSTAGDGDLYAAVYAVYGRQFAKDMTPVEGKWESCRLTGYVTRPMNTRGNRNYQQFFVNGRFVKSRLMSAALEEAYRNQIMQGRFPGCVLMLQLPEDQVDVNVHPAKTEVKFLSEQTVFDCVRYGVQSALQKAPARPEVTLKPAAPAPVQEQMRKAAAPEPQAFRTMTVEEHKTFSKALQGEKPAPAAPTVVREALAKTPPAEAPLAEQIRIPMPRTVAPPPPAPRPVPKAPEPVAQPPAEEPEYRLVGPVLTTYIIVEQGSEVLFIDKHAAHERILFEKLKKIGTEVMSQTLLTPAAASLTPEEAAVVLENTALFETCGFMLEDFGDGCVLIRGVPADLPREDAESAVSSLAAMLLEGRLPDPESLRDEILHTVACKAAIKAGWQTAGKELELLTAQVMAREDLKYCPHGRPICVKLTEKELEKFFKRS